MVTDKVMTPQCGRSVVLISGSGPGCQCGYRSGDL